MNKKELVKKYRPLVSLACSAHNVRNIFRIKGAGKGCISAPWVYLWLKNNIEVDIKVKCIEDSMTQA